MSSVLSLPVLWDSHPSSNGCVGQEGEVGRGNQFCCNIVMIWGNTNCCCFKTSSVLQALSLYPRGNHESHSRSWAGKCSPFTSRLDIKKMFSLYWHVRYNGKPSDLEEVYVWTFGKYFRCSHIFYIYIYTHILYFTFYSTYAISNIYYIRI